MILNVAHNGVRGEPVSVAVYIEVQCSLLPAGRQKLLDMCLNLNVANKLTHAIFIDDDMQFPNNILDGLMWDGKCVGANYLRKEGNDSKKFTSVGTDGTMLSSIGKGGLEDVESCGLGMFCMDLKEVLKTDVPHFEVKYDKRGAYLGEDVYFMNKLKEAGVKVMVNHDISQKVGHIGEWVYKL